MVSAVLVLAVLGLGRVMSAVLVLKLELHTIHLRLAAIRRPSESHAAQVARAPTRRPDD